MEKGTILYRVVFLVVGSIGRAQGEDPGSCSEVVTDSLHGLEQTSYLSQFSQL